MNNSPNKTLNATLLTMIVLQTVGTIDTRRQMPAPKQYVAITVLWGIFFLIADLGQAKLMARLSLLVLLPALVLGPFGKRLVTWVELIARLFAQPQDVPPAGTPNAPNTGPGHQGGGGSGGLFPPPQGASFPAPVSPLETS